MFNTKNAFLSIEKNKTRRQTPIDKFFFSRKFLKKLFFSSFYLIVGSAQMLVNRECISDKKLVLNPPLGGIAHARKYDVSSQ